MIGRSRMLRIRRLDPRPRSEGMAGSGVCRWLGGFCRSETRRLPDPFSVLAPNCMPPTAAPGQAGSDPHMHLFGTVRRLGVLPFKFLTDHCNLHCRSKERLCVFSSHLFLLPLTTTLAAYVFLLCLYVFLAYTAFLLSVTFFMKRPHSFQSLKPARYPSHLFSTFHIAP